MHSQDGLVCGDEAALVGVVLQYNRTQQRQPAKAIIELASREGFVSDIRAILYCLKCYTALWIKPLVDGVTAIRITCAACGSISLKGSVITLSTGTHAQLCTDFLLVLHRIMLYRRPDCSKLRRMVPLQNAEDLASIAPTSTGHLLFPTPQ